MGRFRRNVLGATAVALALAATSCAGGEVEGSGGTPSTSADPTSTTTSASPPSSTAPAETTEEDEVLAAYQGYWDTWLAANDPPDPDHPGIDRYYTGAALTRVQEAIDKNRAFGRVVRLPSNSVSGLSVESIESRSVDEVSAIICEVDDSLLLDAASGRVLNDATVTSRNLATFRRDSTDWKVEDVVLVAEAPGAVGCPS